MELLQLKYFCDAALTENFSKTAKKYNVPPSNISQSIKRLENELGTKLFNRKSNSLSLNEQGKNFYDKINNAINMIDTAKAEIKDREESGLLKICILTNRSLSTASMEKFRSKYPDVVLMSSYNLPENNDFDLIIADDTYKFNETEKEPILLEEISLAINKENPLSKKDYISLMDLANEHFICMNKGSSMYEYTFKICNTANFTPNVVIESPDPAFIRKCVELNLGITFVPTVSWKGYFSDNVQIRKIEGFRRTTYMYINKNKFIKKCTKNFIDIVKSEFSKKDK